MANVIDKVVDVNPSRENWRIQVRIVRLWNIPKYGGSTLPYAQEMVLLDQHGGKIHASVRKTLVFKFFTQLKEGEAYELVNFGVGRNVGNYKTTHHEYKLNFDNGTFIRRLRESAIPNHGFTFIDLKKLSRNDFDVIGILSGVGSEKDYEDKDGKSCRFNVIELQSKGCKVDCALFGEYVQQLNYFLQSGDVCNAMVIIQFARVKNFKGKFVLQNSMYATKVFYNLDVPVALEFKNSFEEYPSLLAELQDVGIDQSLESDFLTLQARKTIEELKDCKEDGTYVVLANVNQFAEDEEWWYTACSCNRAVHPYSSGFLCQPCKMILLSVTPRYKIKMRLLHDTDSCSVIIFDKEGSALLKKTCEELVTPFLKTAEDTILPKEITSLSGKTFLFKIEVKILENQNFEPSYRVKRVTDDASLIKKFKDLAPRSNDVDCTFGSIPESKFISATDNKSVIDGKNLLGHFSFADADKDSSFGENCDKDMLTDGCDLTPCKSLSDEMIPPGFEDSCSSKMKKTIKQEKEE